MKIEKHIMIKSEIIETYVFDDLMRKLVNQIQQLDKDAVVQWLNEGAITIPFKFKKPNNNFIDFDFEGMKKDFEKKLKEIKREG